MISGNLDHWMVALLILGAVTVSMIGAGWAQLLEHQRRNQAMEVIKAAMQAGREPPQVVYDQLRAGKAQKAPWSEVVVFTALSFGFWIGFATADGDSRTAFLVVAATMTVTAIGCLALAIMRPGGAEKHDESE